MVLEGSVLQHPRLLYGETRSLVRGGDPKFADAGIMDDVLGEAGILTSNRVHRSSTSATKAYWRPRREVRTRRMLSGLPASRDSSGSRRTASVEGFTPECLLGDASCPFPGEPGGSTVSRGSRGERRAPAGARHRLAEFARSTFPMNSAPVAHHFSEVCTPSRHSVTGGTARAVVAVEPAGIDGAEAVTVYVFPNYSEMKGEPGPNGKRPVINIGSEDLGLQMRRMAALLDAGIDMRLTPLCPVPWSRLCACCALCVFDSSNADSGSCKTRLGDLTRACDELRL